jgi:AraC family transcriptional regulator
MLMDLSTDASVSREVQPSPFSGRGVLYLSSGPAGATDIVAVSPASAVRRRSGSWDGMRLEIVQATRREALEIKFRPEWHMLVVHAQGARSEGETMVASLTRSPLRDFKGKLTFVPAGHDYRETQVPRILSRVIYLFIDPASVPVGQDDAVLAPKLFFENAELRDTALKLAALVEAGAGELSRAYMQALGAVLVHELVRLNQGTQVAQVPVRGGLAAWQERIVTAYIEEHLAETIPLAKLASLVRLSPFYFARAFKESFGVPPHRYHVSRRIDQAKSLLAKPHLSVTEIGLTVGFSETSSFSATFRKVLGVTPSAYRRSLA